MFVREPLRASRYRARVQPYRVIERKSAPDGTPIELVRHGDAWIVRAGGHVLMSSRSHRSEQELARLALPAFAPKVATRVLVGGLGLGFTLRAVLDRVGTGAHVEVAELVPAVVEWNQTTLAELADNPMQDARVSVRVGDVADVLASSVAGFDVVLLDVDNGPVKVAHAANDALYGAHGSRAAHAALRPGGVLAVWSSTGDARYVRTLERAGFGHVREHSVRAHGSRHVVFVAVRA